MSKENIDIGINIELTARSAQTLKELEGIADAIERLGRISQQSAQSMTSVGRSLIIDGQVFQDIAGDVAKFNEAMKGTVRSREFKRFLDDTNLVVKTHNREMQLLNINYQKAEGVLGIFKTTPGMAGIKNASQAMKTLRTDAGLLSTEGIRVLQKSFKELKLSPEMWQSLDAYLGKSNQKLLEVAKNASMSGSGLDKVKSTVDAIVQNTDKFLQMGDAMQNFAQDPNSANLSLAADRLATLRKDGKLTAEAVKELNMVLGTRMPVEAWQELDKNLGSSNENLLTQITRIRELKYAMSDIRAEVALLSQSTPQTLTSVREAFANLMPTSSMDQLKNASKYLDTMKTSAGGFSTDMGRSLNSLFGKSGLSLPIEGWNLLYTQVNGNTEEMIKLGMETVKTSAAYQDLTNKMANVASGKEGLMDRANLMHSVNLELQKMADLQKMTTAAFGTGGMMALQFGRDLFWVGLGAMFAIMSLSRLSRSYLAVESAELSLLRSKNSLADANERLQRYMDAGINSGRGYRDAVMGQKEAVLAEKLAQDRLRESVVQNNYAMLMFAFGTLPTVIRGVSDLTWKVVQLAFFQDLNTFKTWQAAVAEVGFAGASKIAMFSVFGLTLSLRQLALAIGLVIGGLTLGLGAITAFMGEAAATASIEKMNKEFEKTHDLLNKPHSPPLIQSFSIMADDLKQLDTQLKGFGTSTGPTIKASMNPSLSALSSAPNTGGNVIININGSLTVRSEKDVTAIGNKILSGVKSRGVRV